nr:immunoglobulin light chain junction region [Mus musculus]NSL98222.1 immunoglobulin light chain junction region [Mus musculus]NSL98340.1 immunoglobulin light chain junction region [Mus musculus]NSL98591.1 immunoglobulin light chain junction region [Mus musculus]NSL98830.1 immunoglobulin light chain junction region [Mus musculus]
CQQHLHIPYTF